MAPENPFPAAVEDADAVVRWIRRSAEEIGGDPTRIVLAGDSAEGAPANASSVLPSHERLLNGLRIVSVVRPGPPPDAKSHRALSGFLFAQPLRLGQARCFALAGAGFGRIINIGSIHSLVASPFKSAYVAAKHALLGFSKTVALETAGADITINTICPAYVRTPLVEAQIKAQARTRQISEEEVIQRVMLQPMPKQDFITFEEIAAAVGYLMSPLARNVTGQTITIDGAWTAQ